MAVLPCSFRGLCAFTRTEPRFRSGGQACRGPHGQEKIHYRGDPQRDHARLLEIGSRRAVKAGNEFGAEIVWDGTVNEKDKEGQIKIIQSQVVNQVNGICLAPIDRTALIRPVEQAHRDGSPR